MKFGEVLRKARLEKGMTMTELAKLSECSHATIGRVEAGGCGVSFDTALLASKALGFSLDALEPGKFSSKADKKARMDARIDRLKAKLEAAEKRKAFLESVPDISGEK